MSWMYKLQNSRKKKKMRAIYKQMKRSSHIKMVSEHANGSGMEMKLIHFNTVPSTMLRSSK